MIGKTISHYKILEKLGEGGMGVVYKAVDTKLRRTVALKFLPPELTRDSEARARFIQEAQAASALDHPNICTIHEIDETDEGQTFIAMACYDGESLKTAIERGPLNLDVALDIAVQIAYGLLKAHDRGIIHRDIKPANILITSDGLVKIVDFGIAKLSGMKLTKTGKTLGTVQYMSPEQARGENVDKRTDIWSLGIILYEMLTGNQAFRGEYEQAVLYAILNEEPPPVRSIRSGVPPELEGIVRKALAKKPPERYQGADDLIVDLKAVMKTSGISITRPGIRLLGHRPRRHLRIVLPAAIVAASAALLLIFNPFKLQLGLQKTAAAESKSIAVLPFTNMSDSKEDEFFSDGITEDIITHLSNIGELKVISRTSAMQYKNTSKNLRDIAKELNVATVLEGSVRREGNQVRIAAQLIDAKNDQHMWAHVYDKEMTQIFAIQSEVARQIAAMLKAKLSPQDEKRLEKRATGNIDAYSYYLKGREYYYRATKQDNENAIELFKKALELDPDYALAYAGLGDAYRQRTENFDFPGTWVDSAIAVSEKAISIDPNLPEGYHALGFAYSGKGWIRKRLEAYRKAIDLNPNHHPTLQRMGSANMALGNLDEALLYYKKSLSLDPMIALKHVAVGLSYQELGYSAKAEQFYNQALALQPNFWGAHLQLGWMYLSRGENAEALAQAQKVFSAEPSSYYGLMLAGLTELIMGDYAAAESYYNRVAAVDSSDAAPILGYIYMKSGRQAEAQKMFERTLRSREEHLAQGSEIWADPYEIARVKAMQGNTAEACVWLRRAINAGCRNYVFAEGDPLMENIRSDDRFKQMMAELKTSVDEMRRRVEKMEKDDRI